MRRIPVYLTAVCLTLGAAAAFAGTTPKVQPSTQPAKTTTPTKTTKTTTTTAKPAPVRHTVTKAAHHHHRHHQKPVPKKS
jgi:hypothetical protein